MMSAESEGLQDMSLARARLLKVPTAMNSPIAQDGVHDALFCI